MSCLDTIICKNHFLILRLSISFLSSSISFYNSFSLGIQVRHENNMIQVPLYRALISLVRVNINKLGLSWDKLRQPLNKPIWSFDNYLKLFWGKALWTAPLLGMIFLPLLNLIFRLRRVEADSGSFFGSVLCIVHRWSDLNFSEKCC